MRKGNRGDFQPTLLKVVYVEFAVDNQLLFSIYRIQPQPIRLHTGRYGNSSSLFHRRFSGSKSKRRQPAAKSTVILLLSVYSA